MHILEGNSLGNICPDGLGESVFQISQIKSLLVDDTGVSLTKAEYGVSAILAKRTGFLEGTDIGSGLFGDNEMGEQYYNHAYQNIKAKFADYDYADQKQSGDSDINGKSKEKQQKCTQQGFCQKMYWSCLDH